MDRNGQPVPDGTSVQFVLSYPQEGVEQVVQAQTHDGIGTTPVTLDRVGQLDITVQSEPALSSVRLQLTIREDQSVVIFSSTPTPTPTPSVEAGEGEVETGTVTPTPEAEVSKIQRLPEPLRLPRPQRGRLLGWALMGTLIVGALGIFWGHERKMQAGVTTRLGLLGIIGSLTAYVIWVTVGRFRIPAWYYGIAQREFMAGGVTLGIGGIVLLVVMLVDSLQHDRQDLQAVPAERASRRASGR